VTVDAFTALRGLLFSIAYRMLGTVGDAEDVVQDTYLRYQGALSDGTEIIDLKRYLTTIATRLSIDALREARRTREHYVGTWLPEPLITDPDPGPAEVVESSDTLSIAFLVVLDTLKPVERAVFLLRDVFDVDYAEIAEIVERTPDNCRQIAVRAREHLAERRPRGQVDPRQRRRLAEGFFLACQRGDLVKLKQVLAEDISFTGDGGGNAPAAARDVVGVDKVLRMLIGLLSLGQQLGATSRFVEINGQPGTLNVSRDGEVISIFALDIADGQIQAIHSVVNPEKLRHLGDVADLRAMMRDARRPD
jgi:RNA polymerase sigma-70 factor (ECF subfamily)